MKVKFPTTMGPSELGTDNEASQLCYSASLCLAQTQHKKKKFFGKNKLESSFHCASKTLKVDAPQVLVIESPGDSHEMAIRVPKPQRIPKAILGEIIEQVELVEGNALKMVSIGSELRNPLKQRLVDIMREYSDVFARKPEDMHGQDETVVVHKLHIGPKVRTVKQKRRNFAHEWQQVVDEEIDKLLKANFI